MARDRAVEDVLAWFVDLHVHDTGAGLCQREMNVGFQLRFCVYVLARPSQVGDMHIGIDLIVREVVQASLNILDGDFKDFSGIHLQDRWREREVRHLDQVQLILRSSLQVGVRIGLVVVFADMHACAVIGWGFVRRTGASAAGNKNSCNQNEQPDDRKRQRTNVSHHHAGSWTLVHLWHLALYDKYLTKRIVLDQTYSVKVYMDKRFEQGATS